MLASSSVAPKLAQTTQPVLCTVLARGSVRPPTTVQALMMPQKASSDSPSMLSEPAITHMTELATHQAWLVEHRLLADFHEADSQSADRLEQEGQAVALLLVDSEVAGTAADLRMLRRFFPFALFVALPNTLAGSGGTESVDLTLPDQCDEGFLQMLLQHARAHRQRSAKSRELLQEVGAGRQRIHQLSEIGTALSSRLEFDDLLQTILFEARRLVGCDAASLYLVVGDEENKQLLFKLSQNDSVNVPFRELHLPYTPESLAGYVAITGHELNLDDVYRLPEGTPYRFNASFDEANGYRTKSMLVLPMRDHRDGVVGVLQFINRLDEHGDPSLGFSEEITELLRAIASQAAVSIQKNQLLRDLNELFESFVQASVKTIERRDPTTSGHSFRVAQTTVALMRALPRSGIARFNDLELSDSQLKEVRYAALLHDFGKIGVSERVLIKPRKVSDERLDVLRYRIELQKERLRRRAVEQQLDLYHGHGANVGIHGTADIAGDIRMIKQELEQSLARLDQYYDWVVEANRPDMVEVGHFDFLQELRSYEVRELDGTLGGLISESDLLALSVRQGSLTPDERREIQSHVVHTQEFLATLHWPPELAGVPMIAGAHHEKMDGSGYPQGLLGEQIPLASRVMTVCDIFDALTAMDRPYKSAMSVDEAIGILNKEVEQKLLDPDVVQVFIDSGVANICLPTSANP